MTPPTSSPALELSIVIPCLNEADTLERCVRKAQRSLQENGIAGEIIVADNGSTDGSVEIATRLGVRVVPARLIRYRLPADQLESLLKIRWWDWPIAKIQANLDLFYGEPATFIARHAADAPTGPHA